LRGLTLRPPLAVAAQLVPGECHSKSR
jgi:hypothetical protein